MLRLRTDRNGGAQTCTESSMTMDILARIRAVIEDELGEFRPFADLPAAEIEAMADRLTRALAPLVEPTAEAERRSAA
jgi:hypothetical protein